MKKILYTIVFFVSFMANGQFEANEDVTITEKQNDDIYLAGESIIIDAKVDGDVVIAGNTIMVSDTITQDLIVAGGTIEVKGYIQDDIRAAGGKLRITGTVGDDVIVFGGEVFIAKETVIHGNLIVFSGDIEINGTIMGMIKAYSGELIINGRVSQGVELYTEELEINGKITGTTKMVAETVKIGENAKFYSNVEYWTESGKVDFKNSLINTSANFNESLAKEHKEFPMKFLGVAAIGIWIFYLLSAFLVILILNVLLKNFLSKAATYLDKNIPKSLGFGLLYIVGFPILILFSFMLIIGIPIGLLLTPIYVFSIIAGHLLAALLLSHYLNNRQGNSWGFWMLSFVALGIAAALRLMTLIPFVGVVVSIILIAIAYGLIGLTLFQPKSTTNLVQ